jgi:hypothetical protein
MFMGHGHEHVIVLLYIIIIGNIVTYIIVLDNTLGGHNGIPVALSCADLRLDEYVIQPAPELKR